MNARYVAAVSAAVIALGGAGSALAASGNAFLAAELRYLAIDKPTLVAKLKQGQTLAQIATAQGKSPQGLIDALVAAGKVKLDAKVKAGKLAKSKETTLLAKLRVQVGKLVTTSFGPGAKIPAVYLKPILAYLQIDEPTLEQELKSGKSLAQIALERGKTAAGVSAAILGPVQAQLDAQVAAGKLTPAERDALLAKAQVAIAKLVAGTA